MSWSRLALFCSWQSDAPKVTDDTTDCLSEQVSARWSAWVLAGKDLPPTHLNGRGTPKRRLRVVLHDGHHGRASDQERNDNTRTLTTQKLDEP